MKIKTNLDQKAWQNVVAHIDPHGRLAQARPLLGGQSATMTAVTWHTQTGKQKSAVIRQPRPEKLASNPQITAVEFQILRALQKISVKTPTPYLLDESCTILPTPYLVMEKIDGSPQYDPPDRIAFATQVATQLAHIHSLNPTDFSLTSLPKTEAAVGRLIAWYTAQTSPSSPQTAQLIQTVTADQRWLTPNRATLLHGDFWPGNWLWSNNKLQAIIDWEDAQQGDPLADFAITRLDMMLIFDQTTMDKFTQVYQAAANLDFSPLPYWDLYAALRAASGIDQWATGWPALGRADITSASMRTAYNRFIRQAYQRLNREIA